MDNRKLIVIYIKNDPGCQEIVQLLANHINEIKPFVRTDIVNVSEKDGKARATRAKITRVPTMILSKIPPQIIVGVTDIRAAFLTIVRTCQGHNRISVPTPDQEILNMQLAVMNEKPDDELDEGAGSAPTTADIQRRVMEENQRRGMKMAQAAQSMPSTPRGGRVYSNDEQFVTDAGIDHSAHDNVGHDAGGEDFDLDENDLHEYLKDASRNG